ncbi:MAG: uridine kinase [Pseudomonadota bacterium]
MTTASALLDTLVARGQEFSRVLVAIVGPPGAGKSTLAETLKQQLQRKGLSTVVVPMDGFHLDNDELDRLNLRDRKGAPNTFDAAAFVATVKRIRAGDRSVSVPGFDREADRVRPDCYEVDTSSRFVLIEGNYLLLSDSPWCQLRALFDLSVMLNPGFEALEARLVQRWLDNNHAPDAARERALSNDIPNAHYVLANSAPADYTLSTAA